MDTSYRKPNSSRSDSSIARVDSTVTGNSNSGSEFALNFDSGSFRDRSSRVFFKEQQVYRTLNSESLTAWRRVSAQPFFREMTAAGQIVATKEVPRDDFELPSTVSGVLQHERIPFISYPYEWSFSMLRQAALLHLQILPRAIQSGMILKDASPYNVQFNGTRAVFIDLGSFTEQIPGEPWVAYRQFCELMLFPLLLQSYRGVDFQPLLRSQLEGIPARQFLQWIRWRDMVRPGVFFNGWLQAALERNTQAIRSSTVKDLKSSGFQTSMILQLISKLHRLVERLRWKPPATQWTQYNDSLPHVAEDGKSKRHFVHDVCKARHRKLVWDLGCNDGRYSIVASPFASTVVAMDQDHGCIDRLYEASLTENKNILPLCIQLANPSPGQGWGGLERKRLEERGQPELILCLGLIHHLVLAANIPLPEVIRWLSSFGSELVLEFPMKPDSMVQALLRNKRDQYDDYSVEHVEHELKRRFVIHRREILPSGSRTIYHAIPKASIDSTP